MAAALVVAVGLSIAAIGVARQADEQRRQAEVRELASAALTNLEANPERSLLLALEAAKTTYSVDGTILPEVEEILHRAIQADRNQITIPMDGSVAFSPDGKMLAIGDKVGDLKLWNATTGKVQQSLAGHLNAITAIAFNPEGIYLATAGLDSRVKIWDVTTNGAVMSLDGYLDTVLDIAYSPDGKQLATAGRDGLILIWDMSSIETEFIVDGFLTRPELLHQSEPAHILPAPTKVSGVAFSSDGQRLAAYIPGASITIWDVVSGQQMLEITGVSDHEADVAFSPNDEFLVGASGTQGATIWNANTGQEFMSLLDSSPIASVAFSHDGMYLGTAARDGTATLWDVENSRQAFRISDQSTGFNSIAFSQDGQQIATGADNGTTRIWDLTSSGSAELFTMAAHKGEVYDVVYDPEGTRIASTGEDGTVKIWDAATGELIHNLPGRIDGVHFPAFSPDGKRLASANNLGGVSLWDSNSGEELMSLSGDAPAITTIAFSPDGGHLAAAGGQEGQANIWNATSGELLASFSNETTLMRLVYSPDGRVIWSYDWNGVASTWDAKTGKSVSGAGSADVCQAIIWDAEFSPDGHYWAAAGYDGLAHVYEVQGEPDEDGPAYSIAYALQGHRGNVTGVAFNPEGTILASASSDGMAKLWDLATGLELITLTDRDVPLAGVEFSPDGRYVATAASDGSISVHIVSVEELMDLARSRLSRDFTKYECQRYLHQPACLEE
jgi:WD40 repeat protein